MLRFWAAVLAAMLIPWPAFGQQCMPRDDILKGLAGKFHEAPVSQAVVNGGRAMLEVFRTVDGSTWSVVLTNPQGCSVMIASGEDWQDLRNVRFPADGEIGL